MCLAGPIEGTDDQQVWGAERGGACSESVFSNGVTTSAALLHPLLGILFDFLGYQERRLWATDLRSKKGSEEGTLAESV